MILFLFLFFSSFWAIGVCVGGGGRKGIIFLHIFLYIGNIDFFL